MSTERATVMLLPMSCGDRIRETTRTVTGIVTVTGMEVGTFLHLGRRCAAVRATGSCVWYEAPCNFPPVMTAERIRRDHREKASAGVQ